MPLLRAEIVADVAYYLNPLWLTFAGRAEAWRESFQGLPYNPTCATVVSGNAAVVYVSAPDNVTASQLGFIAENWSDRVGGVKVRELRVVGNCGNANDDRNVLESKTPFGGLDSKLSSALGTTIDVVKIIALAVVVVTLSRKR